MIASEPGNGGSAATLNPDTSGARETEPTATPFEPPASGYAEMNLYPGDPVERSSSRADFMAVMCAWIS